MNDVIVSVLVSTLITSIGWIIAVGLACLLRRKLPQLPPFAPDPSTAIIYGVGGIFSLAISLMIKFWRL